MRRNWAKKNRTHTLLLCGVALLLLGGCAPAPAQAVAAGAQGQEACPVSEPLLLTPPQDSAVAEPPAEGHYFASADRSIIASAWWWGKDHWRAGQDGNKVGWFRPAGANLRISGRRLDGPALPLEAEVPCCYPTRFQAAGLYFPSGGCWEVSAQAVDQSLTFVVWVEALP